MSGWACPHQKGDECLKVAGCTCVPGMKGCVLVGKYTFATEDGIRRPPAPVKIERDED